jgi:beta-glucosidase/6-phospho-beta-glucosidase/beta-galactosidase
MALTTTITKKSVTLSMEGMYQITYNMVYADGATVLFERDFTQPFKVGQGWSTTVTLRMRDEMKKAIRVYKEEQAIFNGAPIDASVTNLNSTVGV